MASRSRGHGSQRDWDSMREDFDNSNYDSQYPDDSSSDLVKLDHCRLYITNIPKALNEEGLRAAFSKYGTLNEAFINKDPLKRYGLVSFETAGEARHAMMKLNKTEPLGLNISIAHEQKKNRRDNARSTTGTRERDSVTTENREKQDRNREIDRDRNRDLDRERNMDVDRERNREPERKESASFEKRKNRNKEMANGDNVVHIPEMPKELEVDMESLDPEIQERIEKLQIEQLKLLRAELACQQRLLVKQGKKARCVLPDGKIYVRNVTEGNADHRDDESSFAAGGGDSNEQEHPSAQAHEWDPEPSLGDGSSTPSTCKVCSGHTYGRQSDYKDKCDYPKYSKEKTEYNKTPEIKVTDAVSRKSITSKTTDLTSKKSDYSKYTDVSKRSGTPIKKLELACRKIAKYKSDATCDLKYTDFYSDSDDETDETNRLIQLRHSDYMDIVDDHLKIVVALAGYPKSKMRLQQMACFQRCLSEITDMQTKAGLLKRTPSFLDYYLNRGAIVCICKDPDTRDWMVRICSGLQERMCINLILLKAKVKRLCLAILKIPQSCWPATAQDTFKLLQYFNPTLKTDLWKIYSQKTVDDVESTSFLIDRVSGEIIRGPSFKNVIDYKEMEFELTGYTEIYYECLLSELENDLSSVASRVKLLEEIKSENATPRESVKNSSRSAGEQQRVIKITEIESEKEGTAQRNESREKIELESSLPKEVLKKLKDVKYISENDVIIDWSDKTNFSDQETEKDDTMKVEEDYIDDKIVSTSAVSEKTESIIESNDNLTLNRNSNLNIDSNRGIAYHRRTNYLHVENELKIAITLEGYPQDKLEGTHIRRLKHLFKEYLHKDMKNQRFANLIIPKFQDIYLSNGAVIYICDSLETKDYLSEIFPKFINSTGLKLAFRDIKNLVRYTRIVMRLPKEHANVESLEILLKLQASYPGLKPNCWKYYSDVAGKQKRQFGVDPESLDVIKSPSFDPVYEGEKLSFRIIDRQKRDVSFEASSNVDLISENSTIKRLRDIVLKNMYEPIDPEIMNSPLTRIRTNHYSDLIADDLKLYVGPASYPESRIDDGLFHLIKRTLENIVLDSLEKDELTEEAVPKLHDLYLFDGVIFIICQSMSSRNWIEDNLINVNSKLRINLKATEFRGAVGIISMVVKTEMDTDEVISILQKQNPRLRTKFWRKISTVKMRTKLDMVLQIDKLSAQVMTSPSFDKFVGGNAIQYKLGHLQSLIKPKASLEELSKILTKKVEKKPSEKSLQISKSKVSMQGPKDRTFDELRAELRREYPALKVDDWNVIAMHEKANHKVCDLEIDEVSAKIIEKEDFKLTMGDDKLFFYTGITSHRSADDADENTAVDLESPRSIDTNIILPADNNQDFRKIILIIPVKILPDNKEDLSIIFDLLEDKNPGLNTELWKVFTEKSYPNNGKFTILIDRQSAAVIEGKNFDPTVGGETLKFYFLNIPGLQRARCRECVSCGDAADSFCARCGVTPYCSARCQRRDWVERHSAVCHNLARLKEVQDVNGAVEQVLPVPIIAPLRRPHSPARRELAAAREAAPKEPVSEGREDNSGKKFIPSGQRNRDAGGRNFSTRDGPNRPLIDRTVKPERSFDKQETSFDNPERSFDKQDKSFDKQDRSFDKPERSSDKPNRSSDKPNRSSDNKDRQAPRQDRSGQESGTKPFRKPQGSSGGEDWGAKGHRRQNPDQAHKVNLLLLKANGIRNVLNLQQLANRTNSETVEQMDEESGASKPQPSVTPTKPEPKVPPMNTSSPVKTPIKQTPVVRAANQRESASPANQNAAMSPAANQKEVKPPAANAKPPGDATDVTPSRKLVPKNCVIETLSIGDTILLSVDAVASECQTKSTGFICLSLHENFEADYQALCEDFGVACEAEKQAYTPKPGETFSLFNPEDGGWYRARCLSPTQAALIDSSKVVPLTPAGKYTRLPEKYQNIPEFCCLLQANVTVGESLKCVILEKTANGMKVSVEESDGDGSVSSGEASRWLPIVQAPAATAAPIPVVPRPPLVSNSAVFLVHFTNCSDFFVRSAETAAQKKFDDALHDTALYGLSATPLTEPPTMGQYVVSKYTDGLHYRALVKRTNVRQNKYLLEYLDYGNSHINTLENLYPCPATLQPDKMAVMTSQCALLVTSSHPLTPPAEAMLEKLKDDSVELVLTLPYDEQSSPNGSKVTLTVAKNKQSVNKKVEDLITPDWVKLEKSGGDVIETESVMFSELEYLDLPPEGCEVLVLDCGTIEAGIVSGCRKGEAHAVYVLTTLTEKINKYCESELGKEPYLPKAEELCIAQLPPYDQWFRAVLAEQVSGPGGAEAEVCYIDYGNMERVPVSLLRKMLPEFVRGQPALANTLTIKDFPEKPTAAMLERALKHLSLNDEGQGTLVVTRCEKEQPGLYTVSAPALIAAMKGAQ